jgi:hypothetical protein
MSWLHNFIRSVNETDLLEISDLEEKNEQIKKRLKELTEVK